MEILYTDPQIKYLCPEGNFWVDNETYSKVASENGGFGLWREDCLYEQLGKKLMRKALAEKARLGYLNKKETFTLPFDFKFEHDDSLGGTAKKAVNDYTSLDYDMDALKEWFNTHKLDDYDKWRIWKQLGTLRKAAIEKDNRLYHVFHQFSKEFRCSVLRFEGEPLVEIFDISASDNHALAERIQTDPVLRREIPVEERIRFQYAVKNDFRKILGIGANGKCLPEVKHCIKVCLFNTNQKFYNQVFAGLYARRGKMSYNARFMIFMKMYFPHIEPLVERTTDHWKCMFDMEMRTITNGACQDLANMGIKSITCHDAIYVKKSDVEKYKLTTEMVKKLFYMHLNLDVEKVEKFIEDNPEKKFVEARIQFPTHFKMKKERLDSYKNFYQDLEKYLENYKKANPKD